MNVPIHAGETLFWVQQNPGNLWWPMDTYGCSYQLAFSTPFSRGCQKNNHDLCHLHHLIGSYWHVWRPTCFRIVLEFRRLCIFDLGSKLSNISWLRDSCFQNIVAQHSALKPVHRSIPWLFIAHENVKKAKKTRWASLNSCFLGIIYLNL